MDAFGRFVGLYPYTRARARKAIKQKTRPNPSMCPNPRAWTDWHCWSARGLPDAFLRNAKPISGLRPESRRPGLVSQPSLDGWTLLDALSRHGCGISVGPSLGTVVMVREVTQPNPEKPTAFDAELIPHW